MVNLLVITSLYLAICLSFCGAKFTQPATEIVQQTNLNYGYCKSTYKQQNFTKVEVLSRKKRYLVFEKGAALSMATASVKLITGSVPRGLNIITEETLLYELPSSASIPKVAPSKSTPMDKKTKLMHKSRDTSPRYSSYNMQRRSNVAAENTRIEDDNNFNSKDIQIHTLLFQQIERLAKTYGYNGRHCIMRTICEAQHFLYPGGQSLFHDIIRIILAFSKSTLKNDEKYCEALNLNYGYCKSTYKQQNFTKVEVLSRKKRYLVFEKGAALSMATASVKLITGSVPRGLNIITEETLLYELPSSASIPKVAPSKSTPMDKKTKLMHKSRDTSPRYSSYNMQRRSNVAAENTRIEDDNNFNSKDIQIHTLLFQQIERLAKTYGYNGRHCIMRTICEAQHFLYPGGQSLFHDIIRIILAFSKSTLKNDEKYCEALNTVNPMDCANLYGPHCRISFLDYFTVQIYGKFM